MIKKWYNTDAATAAGMLEVSDGIILGWSNGEVHTRELEDEDIGKPGTLTDAAIFGTMEEGAMRMGHISLSCPIVNIRYLRGPRPILPRTLEMSRKDLEAVIYLGSYLVVEPGSTGYTYKQTIPAKEFEEKKLDKSDGVFLTGAEAVEAIMEKDGVTSCREAAILRVIPVIPLTMRYHKFFCKEQNQDVWEMLDIEILYARVLSRSIRLEKLTRMGAPDVILVNERRMLQEYVDALVDNGRRGFPVMNRFGRPMESLAEYYDVITDISERRRVRPQIPEGYTPLSDDKVREAVQKCRAIEAKIKELYPEEDGLVEVRDEALERAQDEAYEAFARMLTPFAHALADKYFHDHYQGFTEAMVNAALLAPEYAANQYDPDRDGPVEEYFLFSMYKQMELFAKKGSLYM